MMDGERRSADYQGEAMSNELGKRMYQKLRNVWERQLAEHLAKPGWSELKYDERIWKQFYEIYKFRPSTQSQHWPGISEPKPSRTYKIDHVYGEDLGIHMKQLKDFYLKCFQKVIPKGQLVIVLDWQHQCYTLNPHVEPEVGTTDAWPVWPLPNGDYHIFLNEDLSGGFFGHPWEQTICVMGEDFVAQLADAPKSVLSNLIRVDGEKSH